MNIAIQRVTRATPEVHDLIGELNAVLGAVYAAQQRHGLSIEQLFEPNVQFFLARLDGLAVGCGGVRRLRRGQAHVYPASGTRSGSCEGASVQNRGRGSWG
jgi:putative acetyltransferase